VLAEKKMEEIGTSLEHRPKFVLSEKELQCEQFTKMQGMRA
jgi:hypothetical protein